MQWQTPHRDRFPLRLRNHDVRRRRAERATHDDRDAPARRRRLRWRSDSDARCESPILGSAAGGGFPQWNCNCAQLRRRARRHAARQAAHAVVDLRAPRRRRRRRAVQRLARHPRADPRQPGAAAGARAARHRHRRRGADGRPDRPRHRPLHAARARPAAAAVVHRPGVRGPDARATRCCACSATTAASTASAIALDGAPFEVPGVAGLALRALPLDEQGGAVFAAPRRSRCRATTSAWSLTDTRERPTPVLRARPRARSRRRSSTRCASADCVLVDGTFWTDDEMIRARRRPQDARAQIGHLPQSGAGRHDRMAGRGCRAGTRRLLIHINNTNPILDEDSAERAAAGRARHRGLRGRHGDRAVTHAAAGAMPETATAVATPPGAATSSRPGCASAAARTTSTIRST